MLEELLARAAEREGQGGRALFVGDTGGLSVNAELSGYSHRDIMGLHGEGGLLCEEDRFDPGDARYDLIIANGTLDSVNDLPGALIQYRRALAPGGLFLGAFMGAGSLAALRSIIAGSRESAGRARFHPQIDVRAAGDLLARAGFAEPVADTETISVSYRSLQRLIGDVRANGLSSALPSRALVTRIEFASWLSGVADAMDEGGRVNEEFCPVYLTGRSPITL
jgi:SAM-dependent methyltransferase